MDPDGPLISVVPDFVLVGLKPESDLTKYLNVHNVVELDALDDTQLCLLNDMWCECFAIQEDCPQLHSQGSSPNPVKCSELVIFIIEISIQSYTSYTWIDNDRYKYRCRCRYR